MKIEIEGQIATKIVVEIEEFPAYFKNERGMFFSKIISPKKEIMLIYSIPCDYYTIQMGSITSALIQCAIPCTREEYDEVFDKIVEHLKTV